MRKSDILTRILPCIAIALLNAAIWLILNWATVKWNPVAVGGVAFGLTFVVMLFFSGARTVNEEG